MRPPGDASASAQAEPRAGEAVPDSGNSGRSEATRAALVRAAVGAFGRDGYGAATTKAIGREARANQALISYYFGGKEGLYRAVVDHIVEEIGRRIGPIARQVEADRRRLETVGAALPESRAAYFDMLCRIVDGLVDVLTSEESAAWAKIIVREQQDPTPAFEAFYARVQAPMLDQMAGLLARLDGRRTPTAAQRLAVLTIVGQVLVFRVARAAALRYLGREALTPRDVASIKKVIRRNTAAMVGYDDSSGGPDG